MPNTSATQPLVGARLRSSNAAENKRSTKKPVNTGSYQQDHFEDRRRHARASYRLKARYLGEDGAERPCVVINVSAGGAMIRAKITPKSGERVVLYIDSVGRFEGTVIRSGKHAFAVQYQTRRAKTQRTADALIRVLNRGQRNSDRRVTPRIDIDRTVTVTHEDGSRIECAIMDISLTGASLAIEPQPSLGSEMIVGRMKARVVRRHDMGVGVVFLGSAKFMDDVIDQTTHTAEEADPHNDGTPIAGSFGRRDPKS